MDGQQLKKASQNQNHLSESELTFFHTNQSFKKLKIDSENLSKFSLVSHSQNSLSSQLYNQSMNRLYTKLTALMLKMQDHEIFHSVDSMLQSMVTYESSLKSEKCRDKLSLIYLFFIGLQSKISDKNNLMGKINDKNGQRANSYLTRTSQSSFQQTLEGHSGGIISEVTHLTQEAGNS